MQIISDGLALEEAFEVLISDYIDYELSVYRISIENIVRGQSERNSNFFDTRRLINRTISNLFSSVKTYVDQIEKISKKYEDLKLKEKTISDEFDKSPIYRFMYRLRNYVQHYDVIIHKKRYGSFTLLEDFNTDEHPHNSSLELIIDKDRLTKSDVFTNKILREMPDEIFITKSFREYLGCLMRVHETTREILNYQQKCNDIINSSADDNNVDTRKIDALMNLIIKNEPTDIIERTKMIGIK
ncbi:MAG: hypothetical protein OCD00_11065 [Colwellia sp.]